MRQTRAGRDRQGGDEGQAAKELPGDNLLGAWLKEVEAKYKPSSRKQAGLAWGRLLRGCGKSPLEVRREDIEEHLNWLEAQGYSPATTANAVGYFKKFFEWCGVQPNPAEGARRPKVERYQGTTMLSREETVRLLHTAREDPSVLGKRDYAILAARLRLGVPLKSLQHLKWGQMRQEEAGVTVQWQAEGERRRLPEEVWEAVKRWLDASGRLEGIQADSYIFTPLAYPWREETGNKAEDWAEGRPLSSSRMLANLKLYGRLAGIGEEKLTLMALQRTATRLRLEEGYSTEEMQSFLESRDDHRLVKYRMGKLPELPKGGEKAEAENQATIPRREARPFKPGEGMRHGLYAISQPMEGVRAILLEDIQGIDEQIVGMRLLGRGLQERMERAGGGKRAVRLGQAYTLAARRLADLIKVEKRLEGKKNPWAEKVLMMLDRVAMEQGDGPVSEQVRWEALGGGEDLTMTSRRLVEEIAATRYVLRNTLQLALESEEDEEYIHLVEIYSIGCNRLVALLRAGLGEADRLTVYLREQIDRAIQDVGKELKLGERWERLKGGRDLPG